MVFMLEGFFTKLIETKMFGAVENKLMKSFIKLFSNFKQTYSCTPKKPKALIPQWVARRAIISIAQTQNRIKSEYDVADLSTFRQSEEYGMLFWRTFEAMW